MNDPHWEGRCTMELWKAGGGKEKAVIYLLAMNCKYTYIYMYTEVLKGSELHVAIYLCIFELSVQQGHDYYPQQD